MSADGNYPREYDGNRGSSARASCKERVLDEVRALSGDAERLFRQAAETSADTLSASTSSITLPAGSGAALTPASSPPSRHRAAA